MGNVGFGEDWLKGSLSNNGIKSELNGYNVQQKKDEMHSLPVRAALKANLKVRLLLLHAGVRGTIGGVWTRREQRGDRREG